MNVFGEIFFKPRFEFVVSYRFSQHIEHNKSLVVCYIRVFVFAFEFAEVSVHTCIGFAENLIIDGIESPVRLGRGSDDARARERIRGMFFKEHKRAVFRKSFVLPGAVELVASYHCVPPLVRVFVDYRVYIAVRIATVAYHSQSGILHTAVTEARLNDGKSRVCVRTESLGKIA